MHLSVQKSTCTNDVCRHMLRESCKPIKGRFNELFHNRKLKQTDPKLCLGKYREVGNSYRSQ